MQSSHYIVPLSRNNTDKVTGRAKGGNDIHLRFNGRNTSLHSVWDGLLISKLQRTLVPARVPYNDFLQYLLEQLEGKYLNSTARWLGCPIPTQGQQLVLDDVQIGGIKAQGDCVESWMEETHQLNCGGVWSFDNDSIFRGNFLVERDLVKEFWAKEYGIEEIHEERYGEYFDVDLSEGEYWQWIIREEIVQKMLIRGGVRLAGVLNGIFDN
jgi:hypothetical protein